MAIFVSFCSFSVKPTDSAYQTHIHYWSVSNFASFDTPNSKFLKKSHFSKKCIFPDLPSKKPPCFAQCFFAVTKFLESSEKWMLCPRDCSFDYFWGLIFWIFSVSEMAIFWVFERVSLRIVVQLVAKFDKIYKNLSINLDSRPVFSL